MARTAVRARGVLTSDARSRDPQVGWGVHVDQGVAGRSAAGVQHLEDQPGAHRCPRAGPASTVSPAAASSTATSRSVGGVSGAQGLRDASGHGNDRPRRRMIHQPDQQAPGQAGQVGGDHHGRAGPSGHTEPRVGRPPRPPTGRRRRVFGDRGRSLCPGPISKVGLVVAARWPRVRARQGFLACHDRHGGLVAVPCAGWRRR